jgi:aspartyl-tRNA(Asn)/glutamyl-tRNA(Gln) amidotransferase subunit A
LQTRGEGFGPEVKRRIMLGTYALSAGYYDAYYLKAQKVRTLIRQDFDVLWEQGFDALVAPTSPTVAFPLGARLADPVAMYLSDACTLPVNMAGLPGLSVPCGLSDGLPVGLQFIGGPWTEPRLLRLGRGYEAITAGADWRRVEPSDLALADDPAQPTPAERMAAAGLSDP